MAEPLKNYYSRDYITKLSTTLRQVEPRIDPVRFRKQILSPDWEGKELKTRMRHIAETLHDALPSSYAEAITILRKVIEQMPRDRNSGYLGMYFPEFVALYGRHDWSTSLPALAWFTRFSSSEFAVRPFILDDADSMMKQMRAWATDRNEHLRRLASEGCRPRLPWAMALPNFKRDPEPVLELLELLKNDPVRYVQKSVANNLNDISKDHPDRALATLKAWQGISPASDWIIKHACRTLLKQSHPEALALFGYQPAIRALEGFRISKRAVKLGDHIEFALQFHVKRTCQLRVEYLIDYLKGNGTHSTKVFQWVEREFTAGSHELTKRQLFAPMTTRRHYPGLHRIRVRINGKEFEPEEFELHT